MKPANDTQKRSYVVSIWRHRLLVEQYTGLFDDLSAASDHGIERANNNGKVIAWPLVELTFDEGRHAYMGGRPLHPHAGPLAVQGWLQAHHEADSRDTLMRQARAIRAFLGSCTIFS